MEHLIINTILGALIIIGFIHTLCMDVNGNSIVLPKKQRKRNKR